MRLKSKLHATCVGIESSTVSGQGRGGQRGAGVWSERVPKLHTLRCTRFTLLAREGQGDRDRGGEGVAGLVSALLCFASLSWTRTRAWTSEKLRTCWKNMHQKKYFSTMCVRFSACVCGCWTCAGRAIYTLNGFCVDRKESQ